MSVNNTYVDPDRRPERNASLDGENFTFGPSEDAQENQQNSIGGMPSTPINKRIRQILEDWRNAKCTYI